MKTYFSSLIPRLKSFSKKLDLTTLLSNQRWILLDIRNQSKTVYFFRANHVLLIIENGLVIEQAMWEFLDTESILISMKENTYFMKLEFLDEEIITLKLDGRNEYAFFANESKFDNSINNINEAIKFLYNKYLKYIGTTESIDHFLLSQEIELIDIPLPTRAILEKINSTQSSSDIAQYIINWFDMAHNNNVNIPIYAFIELAKRDHLSISNKINSELEEYARWRGFESFQELKSRHIKGL